MFEPPREVNAPETARVNAHSRHALNRSAASHMRPLSPTEHGDDRVDVHTRRSPESALTHTNGETPPL